QRRWTNSPLRACVGGAYHPIAVIEDSVANNATRSTTRSSGAETAGRPDRGESHAVVSRERGTPRVIAPNLTESGSPVHDAPGGRVVRRRRRRRLLRQWQHHLPRRHPRRVAPAGGADAAAGGEARLRVL